MTLFIPARWLETWQWHLLVLSLAIKALLIPTYHSTDFEVHRNWLAITHSLPVSQWYFDTTSKWTLDYPPFFAYFSWLLSIPAALWDRRIVDLQGGLEYDDWSCKVFMRLSVIVSETLTFTTALFALSTRKATEKPQHVLPPWCVAAMLLHPGLIIVDHIHFQYNGFLYGILLWSVWAARQEKYLLSAFLFSSLLNFKHIYVYVAPAYFVFLLQAYVIRGGGKQSAKAHDIGRSGMGERLFTLGMITCLPFVASLLPLLLSGLSSTAPAGPIGIVRQMVSRLFPFSRGLNHAYWAANVWALYTFADRVLVKLLRVQSHHGNVTRGIIGDTYFDVLPTISAGHCFLLTLVFTVILCARLWTRPAYGAFVESIALFGLTSFLFGFHVHEKAILIALVPLTLLANVSYTMIRKTFILTVAGVVGLFPLLFEARETPIKLFYTLIWLLAMPIASTFGMRFSVPFAHFDQHFTPTNWDLLVHFAEDIYVGGFALLVTFVEIVHPVVFTSEGIFSTRGTGIAATTSQSASPHRLLSYASAAAASAVDAIPGIARHSESAAPTESILDVARASASSFLSAAAQSAVVASEEAESAVGRIASSVAASFPSSADVTTTEYTSSASMEFLPLLLTSVYCAIGIVWVWMALGLRFVSGYDDASDERTIDFADTATSEKSVPMASKGATKVK